MIMNNKMRNDAFAISMSSKSGKRNRRKRIMSLILTGVMLLGMVGCQGDEKASEAATTTIDATENQVTTSVGEETTTEAGVTEETTTITIEEVVTGNVNLLTGLMTLSDGAVGKRPVAVMVNNIAQSLPQHGVAQADIIFEMPVEGGLTRLMAMYGDYTKVPKICSVRSCREYFPAVSEGFDAIYVNWGMPDLYKNYVASLNLTHYEGMANTGGLFGRDKDRQNAGYSMEHTGYFDGTGLPKSLEKNKWRTDIEADKTGTAFKFVDGEASVVPTGNACTEVKVNFASMYSTFTYDATTNTYLKQHNGKPHVDGSTGTQLAFTNVIVLETSVTTHSDGVHKVVDWKGGNSAVGYYISNGVAQKITWSKASEESPIKLYDESGNELAINRGKSYIAIGFKGKTTMK